VSQALLKRLTRVETRRSKARSIGRWPTIMSCDEWEAVAAPMQARLVSDTVWDPNASLPPAPWSDLSDVSHRYQQPNAVRRRGQTVEERKQIGEQTAGQDEYAAAYRRGERRPDLIAHR
jgi:hypothetical protein